MVELENIESDNSSRLCRHCWPPAIAQVLNEHTRAADGSTATIVNAYAVNAVDIDDGDRRQLDSDKRTWKTIVAQLKS